MSSLTRSFRIAIQPEGVPGGELAAARVVIAGFSRLVLVSVGVFVSIGVIAMLQALLIEPLLIRLDRAVLRRT
jgi:hypothetical protein